MPETEISPAEASRRLGVELGYVYSLIWSGKLAARKLDGRWLVSKQAVDARLQGGKK
jgi:excisionase family DNA binding protein